MKQFTVSTLIIAGLLQMSSVFSVAKEAGWLVVACGAVIIIPVCIMYGKLSSIAGPDVFVSAFGKIPGNAINLMYVLFFVFSSSIDIRQSSNLIAGGMFPGLSPLVMPLLLAPVIFYAATKDTKQVSSLGFIIFISATILTVLDFILQISQIKLYNFLPIIDTTAGNFVQMVFYCVTVVMGKIPVLFFILPSRGSAPCHVGRGALWGCAFLLLVALRDVGILGRLVSYVNVSVFETVQLLDAFGFLSRVEILFVFMHIVCITYTLCLWTGASTDVIAKIVPVDKKKRLFVICGLLITAAIVSVFVFRTSAILSAFLKNIFPFISVWFVIVLPVAALVFTAVRHKKEGKM